MEAGFIALESRMEGDPLSVEAGGGGRTCRATAQRGVRPAFKLQGMMLKLVRELTDIVLRHPGVVIAPLDREFSPDGTREILGISRPLVFRRMDDGRLPFRYERKHRRCKARRRPQAKDSESEADADARENE
jgi:hypothetical protein